MTFKKSYFLWFILILIIEICIAIFSNGGFIRQTFGDILAVILVYCFVRSFTNLKPIRASILALLFAFLIEFLQLTDLLSWFGLQNNILISTILGNTFSLFDLLAYIIGILIVLIFEKDSFNLKKNNY